MKCPECGSENTYRERCPNGSTHCRNCGFSATHAIWDRMGDPIQAESLPTSDHDSTEKLKPCPFCGELKIGPQFIEQLHENDDYKGSVSCYGCGIAVWESQWNTRPIEDRLRRELARWRETATVFHDAMFDGDDKLACANKNMKSMEADASRLRRERDELRKQNTILHNIINDYENDCACLPVDSTVTEEVNRLTNGWLKAREERDEARARVKELEEKP